MGQKNSSSRNNIDSIPANDLQSLRKPLHPTPRTSTSKLVRHSKRTERRLKKFVPLPIELITRILELGVEDDLHGRLSNRYKFLLSTSRISQIWRDSSQALLWQRLYIDDSRRGDLVLRSKAFGRYRTESVELVRSRVHPMLDVEVDTSEKILWGVKGLRQLRVSGFSDEDEDGRPTMRFDLFLAHEGLKDLQVLSLNNCSFLEEEASTIVPYSLHTLELRSYSTTSINLFSRFISSNLHDLSLSEFSQAHEHDFTLFFTSIASQLTTLRLKDRSIGFLPLLHLCTNLKTLDLESLAAWSVELVLERVPSELKHLILRPQLYEGFLNRLWNGYCISDSKLRKLERVSFPGGISMRKWVERDESGRNLVFLCKLDGIEVDFPLSL